MIDARVPLQAAIVARLAVSQAVTDLVAKRVYDRVPRGARLPYVKLRGMDAVDDSDACHDRCEVFVDLDGWSEAPGSVEAGRLGAALAEALDAPFEVEGFAILIHEVRRLRTLTEQDGLTTRADVQLRYVLGPTT